MVLDEYSKHLLNQEFSVLTSEESYFSQDAMSVARNIIKNPKLLPGGGATELTVSATLKQKSQSIEGIEKVYFSKHASSI